MKTRKYLIVLLIILLSGCSLASKPIDKQKDPENTLDTLTFVGLYLVPYTSLDEINDNFNINDKNQTIILFEDVIEDGVSYTKNHVSGNFYDGHFNVSVSEGITKKDFTAKISVLRGMDVYHRIHKVFKDASGNYSLQESMNYLNISSTFANGTNTTDINGELTVDEISISIEIVEFDPLIEIKVIQMDENYTIINENVVDGEDIITLTEKPEIILVEETRENKELGIYKQVTSYTKSDFNAMNEITHSSLIQQEGLYGISQSLVLRATN